MPSAARFDARALLRRAALPLAVLGCLARGSAEAAAPSWQYAADLRRPFAEARDTSRSLVIVVDRPWDWQCEQLTRAWKADAPLMQRLGDAAVFVHVDADARPDIEARAARLFALLRGRAPSLPISVTLTPEGRIIDVASRMTPHKTPASTATLDGLLGDLPRLLSQGSGAIERQSAQLEAMLRDVPSRVLVAEAQDTLDSGTLAAFARGLERGFDDGRGGFGQPGQPRSTGETALLFCAENRGLFAPRRAEAMLRKTMDAMVHGATRDLLAGDCFRGSHDPHWQAVKFEKALGPSAIQCMIDALWGGGLKGGERAKWIRARDNRDTFRRPDGRFAAVRPGFGPGTPYGHWDTWRLAEWAGALSREQYDLLVFLSGATTKGNAAGIEGRNGMGQERTMGEARRRFKRLSDTPEKVYDLARRRLRERFRQRTDPPQPPLHGWRADWEALEMSTLSRVGALLGERTEDPRRWSDRVSGTAGLLAHGEVPSEQRYLSDQAFAIAALLDQVELLGDRSLDARALALAEETWTRFAPPPGTPGLRDRVPQPADTVLEALPVVIYEDGETPSPLSEMARNCARLATITGDDKWLARSRQLLLPARRAALEGGWIYANWGRALAAYLDASTRPGK